MTNERNRSHEKHDLVSFKGWLCISISVCLKESGGETVRRKRSPHLPRIFVFKYLNTLLAAAPAPAPELLLRGQTSGIFFKREHCLAHLRWLLAYLFESSVKLRRYENPRELEYHHPDSTAR
ncbi:hypothetical protein KQX54_009644 [Cotesia glomerata]|uniref:Uncharacterized protein n=1 Tax=Cotesia glomerata TaxID=32391 RepID=A0AAV7J4D4_COTGL|nr:hypothetical protein KQX54_009644 [Cotesia glomerata]